MIVSSITPCPRVRVRALDFNFEKFAIEMRRLLTVQRDECAMSEPAKTF